MTKKTNNDFIGKTMCVSLMTRETIMGEVVSYDETGIQLKRPVALQTRGTNVNYDPWLPAFANWRDGSVFIVSSAVFTIFEPIGEVMDEYDNVYIAKVENAMQNEETEDAEESTVDMTIES